MLDLLDHAIRSGIITNDGSVVVEDYVVHLLEEIYHSYEDKNLFLNQMLQVINDKTRLEHLHFHIDTENNVKIINLLYSAWKQSRFINPSDEANPEYKNTKGPIFLPYKSEKWAGFYFSNANVSFEKQTIKVEFETGKYEEVEVTSPKFAGGKGTVKKEIIEDYKYHPFHPIYIKNVAQQETTIAFESIIPAFLLYVNENKTWWHNFVKTGEYIIDGVTTLSGIGNLAKLRHLARLGEAGSFIATITVAAGAVEVTSGTVSVLLKLTGLEDTETGKNLQEFLFYLELITLAGEVSVALKKGLQKSAKNLVEKPDDLAKLEKQLDDLVEEGKATRQQVDEVIEELRKVAEFDNIAKNLDSIRLSKLDLEDWIKAIRKIGGDVKYYTSSKKMIRYFKEQKCGVCFDPWEIPPIIWIRKDATALEMFHESLHFEDFLRRGKDAYIRGEARQILKVGKQTQIPYRDQLISSYIKEKYVLDKILEEQANWIKKYGKGRFTEQEIEFSKKYFQEDVIDKCIEEGINISKITIKK